MLIPCRPLDIGAAVHGGPDRSIQFLSLHPDILRANPAAPIALPNDVRRSIFEDDQREYPSSNKRLFQLLF
jgi:hypothetical protein